MHPLCIGAFDPGENKWKGTRLFHRKDYRMLKMEPHRFVQWPYDSLCTTIRMDDSSISNCTHLKIYGNNNIIRASCSKIYGNNNIIVGSDVHVFGNSNEIKGDDALNDVAKGDVTDIVMRMIYSTDEETYKDCYEKLQTIPSKHQFIV